MTTKIHPLEVGDTAPDFTLPIVGPNGQETALLKDLLDKPLVLFFYPKDDTPGCTKEAVSFSEKLSELEKAGVRVVGMSPDPIKKHVKFQEKHSIKVPLLSDEEKTILTAFGVWVEKSMYGKKYMGVERSTFLIGSDGKVLKVWRKVKVPGHVDDVLASVKELV